MYRTANLRGTKPFILGLVVLMALSATNVHAAFCALRDPVGTIKTLFPESTGHKSVVKLVGEAQRQAVSRKLPPNTLHFSELGQHTLYVVFADSQPLGYVHVRSEESRWGLVEVAWAMDTKLRVKDFRFQRCRSRARRHLETDEFRAQLQGRDYHQLRSLLAADGMTVDATKLSVPPGAEDLASVLLRCGLKTLLVTELVWEDEVSQYAGWTRAMAHFKDVGRISSLAHDEVLTHHAAVARFFPEPGLPMDGDSAQVLSVLNPQGQPLGAIYRHLLDFGAGPSMLEWHIDPQGQLLAVNQLEGWQDQTIRDGFEQQLGVVFDGSLHCASRPALLTKQAVLTAMMAMGG